MDQTKKTKSLEMGGDRNLDSLQLDFCFEATGNKEVAPVPAPVLALKDKETEVKECLPTSLIWTGLCVQLHGVSAVQENSESVQKVWMKVDEAIKYGQLQIVKAKRVIKNADDVSTQSAANCRKLLQDHLRNTTREIYHLRDTFVLHTFPRTACRGQRASILS